MTPTCLTPGQFLILEQGRYDDKSWSGPYLILKDLPVDQLSLQFERQFVPEFPDSPPNPQDFLIYLLRSGYIAPLQNSFKAHLGEYGAFDPGPLQPCNIAL